MSTNNSYYPLTFAPALKSYIWGGRNLEEKFGRILPPDTIIAESWEISAHPDGESTVLQGVHAGLTLSQLHQKLGIDLIGTRNAWAQAREKFPLLIKLLDANHPLSVQVHPRDEYALAHEGNELGKTEMWVILHAEPDAAIILGVTEGTTPEQFATAIQEGRLEPHLHYLPVRTGDHVCVPAGSLHAILGGILIAEIQQNSNTTYRVYDWNRVDQHGKSRPLHIAKALDVTNFSQVEPHICAPELVEEANGVRRWLLCHNEYFTVERVELESGASWQGVCDGSTLEIWGVIEGAGEIGYSAETLPLTAIQFALLPAVLGEFTISAEVPSTFLRAYVS